MTTESGGCTSFDKLIHAILSKQMKLITYFSSMTSKPKVFWSSVRLFVLRQFVRPSVNFAHCWLFSWSTTLRMAIFTPKFPCIVKILNYWNCDPLISTFTLRGLTCNCKEKLMLKIRPKNKRVTNCNTTMQAFSEWENPKCMNPKPRANTGAEERFNVCYKIKWRTCLKISK